MKLSLLSIIAASVVVWSGGATALGDDSEYLSVAKRAIDSRMQLKKWHIRVIPHRIMSPEKPSQDLLEQILRCDGHRSRIDTTFKDVEGLQGLSPDPYTDSVILTETEEISFSTRKYLDGSRSAIQSSPPHHNSRKIDIRAFGMTVNGLRGTLPLESFFFNTRASNLAIADAILGGIPCKLLSLDYTGGTGLAWIAPELGWSPIRFEYLRDEGKPSECRLVSTVDVTQWNQSGLWFPKRITYESYEGGSIQEHLEWLIEVKSLNTSLPDEMFDIASFTAPIGTSFYKNPESLSANLIWDGEKVVADDLRTSVDSSTAIAAPSAWRTVLLANGVVFCVVCVVCIRRFVTRASK